MSNDDLRLPYQAGELPVLDLGGIILDGKLLDNAPVNLVLKSFNRHGLIAGATGSGKTKTIQVLSEQLSQAGVPCLVMDIKGDVSGLAEPGEASDFLIARGKSLNIPYTPKAFPVEMLTLNSDNPGVPMRATVSDFGALLFSRMLDVNDTQAGVVTIVFEYARENQLPLVDLDDFKAVLQFAQSDAGKGEIEARYGAVASTSIGTIMRKVIELEAQGGKSFFGEPGFNVLDLLRSSRDGQGIISILRLMDMQDKPKLFSTFMLKLLSDVYRTLPELGDPDKPKLVLFIDEAHLIFNNASKALLNLLDTIVKLIRSKGVGLIFCTQTPNDIPDAVLSQLGLKIQHALRAFTAKDRQAMKLVAQNFPPSDHYNTEQLLTSLGIGEALLSALDGKGQPTPLIQCMIRPPQSRMGVLTETEIKGLVAQSSLYSQYGQRKSTRPASEILAEKKKDAPAQATEPTAKTAKAEPSMVTVLTKNTLFRQLVRQFFRQLLDAAFKALGIKRR
ncbi:helicase HerA-like domain-containing protein [Legionella sp. CNM-4043-24]|uniref:helicase HerA-like domain-containing protein n=1 Tax=Legionella sp. CNM-4043-24 TaxID=3421646 RepID=UPI00403B15E1